MKLSNFQVILMLLRRMLEKEQLLNKIQHRKKKRLV
jgi:hypothetical protein